MLRNSHPRMRSVCLHARVSIRRQRGLPRALRWDLLTAALRNPRVSRAAQPTAAIMASCAREVPASMATVPGVTERYFTRWYKPDVKGNQCEDHCILQHSNRICVITIADAHPLLQKGKSIKSISYQISANCSRLQNKVSGKSKRGAQFLTELAPLCRILCSDGEEYTIYSCVRGKLIEVNENILDSPSLLQEKTSTEGYIAVVLPKFEESKKITQGLLTREQYEELLSKRFNSTSLCNMNENLAEI